VHVEVSCRLGTPQPTSYTLRVDVPEQAPVEMADLPCEPKFRRLDWVGFVANGNRETTFYVDDIAIEFDEE